MGWLWSSSSGDDDTKTEKVSSDGKSTKKPDWSLTDEQRRRIFSRPDALQRSDRSRDAEAERELETFLNSISPGESKTDATSTPQAQEAQPEPQPQERTDHDRIREDGSLNISPAALYPRTMSCRQSFDQAFYCQSLGGKFNDIYRFGHLQSCSEHWGAFWFCMRMKSLPQEEREKQIREYYAAREDRKRNEFGNSERVWEIRKEPVMKAFWKDPDAEEEDAADLHLEE